MQLETRRLCDLKPYMGNAKKHPQRQIEQIKASIRAYGFNDPIAIDENNVILEGHGRFQALTELGYDEIPVIVLAGLTDAQRREYILVHNRLTMTTGFDYDILKREFECLPGFNPHDFGFNRTHTDHRFGEHREQTFDAYLLQEFDAEAVSGFYQMPTISKTSFIPEKIIGFNYMLNTEAFDCGVHFFIDDYQFERLWMSPARYISRLKRFACVFTPDWSLYMNMPVALKVYNVYRSRLIGQILQRAGIIVIPTVSWAEPATYEFCFDGLPQGGTVATSTVGVKRDNEATAVWLDGMREMMTRLRPKTVIQYGGDIDFNYQNATVVRFKQRNGVSEKL